MRFASRLGIGPARSAGPPPTKPPPIGFLDSIIGNELRGWAFDPETWPEPPTIEILVDDEVIATATPNIRRQDVLDAGYPTDLLGFSFILPSHIVGLSRRKIAVRFARTQLELTGSPKFVFWARDGTARVLVIQSARLQPEELAKKLVYRAGKIDSDRAKTGGVLIYAVYSESGAASPAVQATAAAFREAGYTVVIVNNCLPRCRLEEQELQRHADCLINKMPGGRDFGAWLTVASALFDELALGRELLFLNDSLIGPIRPISHVVKSFRASGADLWGMSESYDRAYHLQSSLFAVTGDFFASSGFGDFLHTYSYPEEKNDVILLGEIVLTQTALLHGARVGCLAPYDELAARWLQRAEQRCVEITRLSQGAKPLKAMFRYERDWMRQAVQAVQSGQQLNPQHYFWETLIHDFGYPFIKRDLLANNPLNVPIQPRLWDTVGPSYQDAVREMIRYELVYGDATRAPPAAPLSPSKRADVISFENGEPAVREVFTGTNT